MRTRIVITVLGVLTACSAGSVGGVEGDGSPGDSQRGDPLLGGDRGVGDPGNIGDSNAGDPAGGDPADGDPAGGDISPPAIPANFSATAVSQSQINVTWDDVANNTGCILRWSPNGTDTWTGIGSLGADSTSYNHVGLSASTTYYYDIVATSAAGDSPAASTSETTLSGTSTISPLLYANTTSGVAPFGVVITAAFTTDTDNTTRTDVYENISTYWNFDDDRNEYYQNYVRFR